MSQIVTGPRINWFALKVRKYCVGINAVTFQDRCIKKYKKLLNLDDEQI